MNHYVLDENGDPQSFEVWVNGELDLPRMLEWASRLERDRSVQVTMIGGLVRVSTAFLGLDTSFRSRAPLMFETMVFDDGHPKVMRTEGLFTDGPRTLRYYPDFGEYTRRHPSKAAAVQYHDWCVANLAREFGEAVECEADRKEGEK